MKRYWHGAFWFLKIVVGCALFALGFDLFLAPHNINDGGLAGLGMIFIRLTHWGSVGWFTLVVNIPLFLIGGKRVGKKFFFGSLAGAVALSVLLELFELLPAIETEPLLGALYGGLLCGAGLGLVFLTGASTGGVDILVRLMKLHWKEIPLGKIFMAFDGAIVLLTGIVFQDLSNILYCGIIIYVRSIVMDAVIYSFDYSKVALIISPKHEQIASAIAVKLDRGVTYLYGQGFYSGTDTKAVLTAIKRQQLAELKALVIEIDPSAFVIIQDSHQVLGEGFAHYSGNEL